MERRRPDVPNRFGHRTSLRAVRTLNYTPLRGLLEQRVLPVAFHAEEQRSRPLRNLAMVFSRNENDASSRLDDLPAVPRIEGDLKIPRATGIGQPPCFTIIRHVVKEDVH